MAHDAHFRIRAGAQTFGKTIQHGGKVALDVVAAGVKRDVAGDFQLQLVVRRLHHIHARATGGGFHFALAFFLVAGPDIGANAAHGRTRHRAHACFTAGGCADGGACQCAHACTNGGLALGGAHAIGGRTAGNQEGCRHSGSHDEVLAHDGSFA